MNRDWKKIVELMVVRVYNKDSQYQGTNNRVRCCCCYCGTESVWYLSFKQCFHHGLNTNWQRHPSVLYRFAKKIKLLVRGCLVIEHSFWEILNKKTSKCFQKPEIELCTNLIWGEENFPRVHNLYRVTQKLVGRPVLIVIFHTKEKRGDNCGKASP